LNEPNDSEKDLFILMNEFEQESQKRASQNRARWPFELTKLKLCYLFIIWVIVSLDTTLIHHLESFKPFEQFAVCTETVFWPWTVWFPLKSIIWRKILECFHQKPQFLF